MIDLGAKRLLKGRLRVARAPNVVRDRVAVAKLDLLTNHHRHHVRREDAADLIDHDRFFRAEDTFRTTLPRMPPAPT